MLERWGSSMVRLRWAVLAAAVGLLAAGATWGTGVFGSLTGGGFTDPDSESIVAQQRITEELGDQDPDLIVLYSAESTTVDDPAVAAPVTATLERLRQRPEVVSVSSWYDAQVPAFISHDRRATYAAVDLRAEAEDALLADYRRIAPLLEAPGVTTELGGLAALFEQSNEQTERDVVRAELISFPVLLVMLVLLFRGMVAAVTPLLVGGLAILGAFVATRLLTMVTDVSIFAINLITVIGLGMAIDYALLVVNRFREELAAGRPVSAAVARTLATAGRAVMFSGITTMLALASLLIYPHVFLRSMAYGGVAAIGVAMVSALTVLPAFLAVLGHRVNAGRVRLPWRPARPAPARPTPVRPTPARPAPADLGGNQPDLSVSGVNYSKIDGAEGGWARLARSVMRRPVPYLVGVLAVLAVLAAPALRVEFGGFDERVLPPGAEARVVSERVAAEFPTSPPDPVQVLVSGAPPVVAQEYANRLARLPEVTGAQVTAQRGDSALVAATYPGEPTGRAAWDAVRAVREQPQPPGAEVLVGGRSAVDLDLVAGLAAGLPWMLLLMAGAIMLVLFVAFRSVLLPIKTVVLNLLSIGAATGVVVWGFQDGHLSDLLGFTPTGYLQPAMLLLMLAVLFGISTDYQVFLLSRVREQWLRTGDNPGSVAYGLQRTGRIITAAALLLIVVVAGFTAGEMAFVKLLGTGMIVAIAVDATLVRALLVPAAMRLLGRWNWWAPGRPRREAAVPAGVPGGRDPGPGGGE